MSVDTTSTNNKDTWIDQETGSATHGSDTKMQSNESYGTKRYSLISFILPASLGDITKISLKLYSVADIGTGRRIDVYQSANTTWSESGACWNTDSGNYTGSSIHNSVVPASAGWQTWDIRGGSATNPLNSLTWGNTVSFTLIPYGTNPGWLGGDYYTKEYSDSTKRPYLEITYTENDQSKMLLVF